MPLTEPASEKIIECLKDNDNKLSGGVIKSTLGLKDSEFKKAKEELKKYGLVELGRGRGGTVSLVEGVPIPTEPPKKSRSEMLAEAREEKEYKKKTNKKNKEMIGKALKKANKDYPDNEIEFDAVSFKTNTVYVRVWNEGRTKASVVGYD